MQDTLTRLLRDCLLNRRATYREIGAATGIPFPCLSRFATGARQSLRGDHVDSLCQYFGLRHVATALTRKRTRRDTTPGHRVSDTQRHPARRGLRGRKGRESKRA